MNVRRSARRRRIVASLLVLAVAAGAVALVQSADHRDSALLTASPAQDIADVYTFRSPADPDNLVLAMTVSSFITPAEGGARAFDPRVLYQFKIDNDGDAVEELVIQAFVTGSAGNQVMHFRGPVPPPSTGVVNRIARGSESATVRVSGGAEPIIASRRGLSVFAGLRDDPFFFDFGRFVQILQGQATSFNDPGQDSFAGFNVLAIVVEVPIAMLGPSADLGIWGTTSTATR